MALKLPTLVYNGKTKTGNDTLVFYNLDVGKVIGAIGHDGVGVVKTQFEPCSAAADNPTGGFAARVNVSENVAAINGIPAKAPLYIAEEIDGEYSEDIDDYTATPTVQGDAVWICTFPDPANDKLICYDNGFSANAGSQYRAIPRKLLVADHYVMQRFEGTISLNDMFVSSYDGLQAIYGRLCTIIVKHNPNSLGLYQEIHYYGNVRVSPQKDNNPSDGNASIEISAEGNFSYMAIFAAAKP